MVPAPSAAARRRPRLETFDEVIWCSSEAEKMDAERHVTFTQPFTVTGTLRVRIAVVKGFDEALRGDPREGRGPAGQVSARA
jgi:hypothetical protein